MSLLSNVRSFGKVPSSKIELFGALLQMCPDNVGANCTRPVALADVISLSHIHAHTHMDVYIHIYMQVAADD